MKNTLAITACLKRCSVAISYNSVVYEVNENIDAAENLVYLANKLIKSNNLDIRKLKHVITSSGPGSFTGIRVAQSFAKGVALSLKISSSCVDYFDVINHIYSDTHKNDRSDRLVVIKSEKNYIYFKKIPFSSTKCNQSCEIGVTNVENILKKIAFQNECMIIGDTIDEIRKYAQTNTSVNGINFYYIDDFKNAHHLLKFVGKSDVSEIIRPLYINASI